MSSNKPQLFIGTQTVKAMYYHSERDNKEAIEFGINTRGQARIICPNIENPLLVIKNMHLGGATTNVKVVPPCYIVKYKGGKIYSYKVENFEKRFKPLEETNVKLW